VTSGKKSSQSDHRQSSAWPKTGLPDRGSYPEMHSSDDDQFDARHYRPLHVTVQLDVCDIQAHLVKVRCWTCPQLNFYSGTFVAQWERF